MRAVVVAQRAEAVASKTRGHVFESSDRIFVESRCHYNQKCLLHLFLFNHMLYLGSILCTLQSIQGIIGIVSFSKVTTYIFTQSPRALNDRQLGRKVGKQVGKQVGRQVCGQVGRQVRRQVSRQVGGQVGGQIGRQSHRNVGKQVGGQVGRQLHRNVGRQVGSQVPLNVNLMRSFRIRD